MTTKIKIAVSDFALPSPRVGSIGSLSGFGRADEGVAIHMKVQAQRARMHPNYRAEAPISRSFASGDFVFEVGGRMDGLFEGAAPRIEEIKTAFSARELDKRLRAAGDVHPYRLQLLTYGYFFYLDSGTVPELTLHLVSTRGKDTADLPLALDVKAYEAWLERRLSELAREAAAARKRAARRKRASDALAFPFEAPRPGQPELIATIERGMKAKSPMLLQAPTGLGKTVGVLYPAMKEALARGQRVIYVTPKNSQHAVAEDAVTRLHDKLRDGGAKLRSMTITAKSKLCFKNEPLCDPKHCEFARDHYTKVAANDLVEELSKKRKLTARVFLNMGKEHEVCPYELQADAARDADAVVCDYSYVFSPRAASGRMTERGLDQEGGPNLVIDEAHNLPARALDYYSPSLSAAALETLREPFSRLPKMRRRALELLDACIVVLKSCAPEGCGAPVRIEPPVASFVARDGELRTFLSDYLDALEDVQPRDPVLRLCFAWTAFTEALEFIVAGRETFFTTFKPGDCEVKITCCDASEMLEERYLEYEHVIGFSATLKPFEYYGRLSGLPRDALATAEFVSPFPRERRKLLIIPQLSSRYSRRRESFPRIADAIARIAALKPGNYFAFFPSFEFLERVLERFPAPAGFSVIKQERRMPRRAVEDVLERLAAPGGAHVLFAVQGGVFAEGVDYPGDMAIGAFVVGPPLPTFELEREEMRAFYERRFGEGAGFDYAYAFPAMAKAVQAAGRVIRSETDRGLIVLMDDRFVEPGFARSMPKDWFDEHPGELVSTSILEDVRRFWASTA